MTQIPLSNNMTVRHFIKTKNCFSSIQWSIDIAN
jgi:hypothetical protein